MKLFFAGSQPTPFRSAALGKEVTLIPGVNEVNDDALAYELVERGVVTVSPETNLNVTSKTYGDKNHEPSRALEGQAIRGDMEALRKSGFTTAAEIKQADVAERAVAEADAQAVAKEAEAAALRQRAEGQDVYKAEVRESAVVGTEGRTRALAQENAAKRGAQLKQGHERLQAAMKAGAKKVGSAARKAASAVKSAGKKKGASASSKKGRKSGK